MSSGQKEKRDRDSDFSAPAKIPIFIKFVGRNVVATDLMAPPKPSYLAVTRTQPLKQCRSFGIFFFFRSQRHWESAGAEGFVGPARRGFLEEDDSTLLPVNYSLLRRAEGLASLEGCVKLWIFLPIVRNGSKETLILEQPFIYQGEKWICLLEVAH